MKDTKMYKILEYAPQYSGPRALRDDYQLSKATQNYLSGAYEWEEEKASPPEANLPTLDEAMDDPLVALFGKYKDDPRWERYMQSIEEYRQEVKERELAE